MPVASLSSTGRQDSGWCCGRESLWWPAFFLGDCRKLILNLEHVSLVTTATLHSKPAMNDNPTEFVNLWTKAQPEVRRYLDFLFPCEADAEDVLQQTATRLWDRFEEYDRDLPFLPWAIRFAYHEALSWRQRRRRGRLVFSQEVIDQIHAKYVDESSYLEVRRRALDQCLGKLSETERSMLMGRYSEHGSVQKHAKKMRISAHKLYYAIDKLRGRLLDCIDSRLKLEGLQDG